MTLNFLVAPDFAPERFAGWHLLNTVLQKRSGLGLHLMTPATAAEQAALIAEGKVDAVYANPFDAARLVRDHGYVAVARPLGRPDEAVIAAHEGSAVTAIEEGGIEVDYNGMKAFIRRSDLARDRADQRPERFGVGDKVDVRVTSVDSKTRKLGLSIKAREIAEEKEAIDQYGSSDSGASLGDILGAALKSKG